MTDARTPTCTQPSTGLVLDRNAGSRGWFRCPTMPVHRRLLKFGEDMAGRMVVRHFRTSVGGKVIVSEVELEYERRLRAMSPAEKMARSAAMFAWTRQQMARRIRTDQPGLTDEQVKWQVALKLYEREPEVVKLIQEHLSHVSS